MELIIGAAVLAIAIVALLGAFLGQVTLNEHARNLSWAMNDANRVMEELRRRNTGCTTPVASPPSQTSWDAWLVAAGGGKSIQPSSEQIVVTCQDQDGGAVATDYCGDGNQVGTGEWQKQAAVNTTFDPLRITVTICWEHRARSIGAPECVFAGGAWTITDSDGDGVIESPAMLATLMTCRQ